MANPTTSASASSPADGSLVRLDLDILDENPFQPRTDIDEGKLAELAASIAKSGLLQPIAVRPGQPGRYHIVAGHRRAAAFRRLRDGSTTDEDRRRYRLIPAQVKRDLDDSQMAIGAFVENVQRADLNPLDEAAALGRIRDLIGAASAKDLAVAVSQNEQRVRRLLRLHEAPAIVRDAVSSGILVAVGEQSDGVAPRRERRRLDLFAALEFARFHEHLARTKPKDADERVAGAIQRALADAWGFRRIQQYIEGIVAGRSKDIEQVAQENLATTVRSLLERSATKVVVRLDRTHGASADELNSTARVLRDLSNELSALAERAARTRSGAAIDIE